MKTLLLTAFATAFLASTAYAQVSVDTNTGVTGEVGATVGDTNAGAGVDGAVGSDSTIDVDGTTASVDASGEANGNVAFDSFFGDDDSTPTVTDESGIRASFEALSAEEQEAIENACADVDAAVEPEAGSRQAVEAGICTAINES